MISGLIAKIISECTLSSYPVFIKKINIPFLKKVLYRLFGFTFISLFFCDWSILKQYLFNYQGLLLSFFTFIHIVSSFRGFELLNGGVASSILYIYPLIILYVNNERPWLVYFFILVGLFLLAYGSYHYQMEINGSSSEKETFGGNIVLERFAKGFGYMIVSALTEAMIYFSVLEIKTTNNWNHLFISYFFGFVILLVYYLFSWKSNEKKDVHKKDKESGEQENEKKIKKNLLLGMDKTHLFALGFNITAALLGYYLRFYSMDKLNYKLYSILSYIGVFVTYSYGYIFAQEKITLLSILGSLIIILSNIYLLYI
jgi:drug/metabolite transporter (DMT)-like permease